MPTLLSVCTSQRVHIFPKIKINNLDFISKRDRGMGLSPSERPNSIHLMALIKTVGHENKFLMFLTKTMKIAHFKTRFFDYFDHYAINQKSIKTNDLINTFYI